MKLFDRLYQLCVCAYVCVYVCVCPCQHAYECMCLWRPEEVVSYPRARVIGNCVIYSWVQKTKFALVLGKEAPPTTHSSSLSRPVDRFSKSQSLDLPQHFWRLDRAGLSTGLGFRVPVCVPGCLVTREGAEPQRWSHASKPRRW